MFAVTSAITTTGYFTVDYGQWPIGALMALALLFFVGGCADSTSGSIKIVRHLVLARVPGREIVRTVHSELVRPVRLNGGPIDQQTLIAVILCVLISIAVFVLGTAILALDASVDGRPRQEAFDSSSPRRRHWRTRASALVAPERAARSRRSAIPRR